MEIIQNLHFSSSTWSVALPMILIGFDVLTGLINAWASHDFKSAIMRKGLSKKLGEIVIIVLGELFSFGLGLPDYIISGILFYIGFMEFMSILENLDKLGVPIPKKIKSVINNDSEEEKIVDGFIEGQKDADSKKHE